MHVLVIGAGVVGVNTAYLLLKQGLQVSMVDRHSQPAQEASYANGCQLSYNYVAPLASPDVFADLPKWLLNPSSPLRFYPRFDWQQWRWLMHFLAACNREQSRRSTADLLGLALRSRSIVHENTRDVQLDYSWNDNGKLIIYRSPALFEKARKQVAYQASLGSAQQVLTAAQVLELEPSLSPIASALAGGVFTPHEEVGDCQQYTDQLFSYLTRQSGFTAHMGCEVLSLHQAGQRVLGVHTSKGLIQADQVVVAAGVRSVPLLRKSGYTPLIYPLKGYSLTLPLNQQLNATATPSLSITDYERRIVYAPLTQRLRVAAMVDIGATSTSLNPSRLGVLQRQAGETFPTLDFEQATPWAGLRPATPTGKPIIGPHPHLKNLWLNIGHGALGFTLAAGSAEALTQHISGAPLRPEYQCFVPT